MTYEVRKPPDLEYDLLNSSFILAKAKNERYAQNLYAALCNNDFIKNDIVSWLKEEHWHCSWRHSGRIISTIRKSGSYTDWYCSGMAVGYDEPQCDNGFVPEGEITMEIKEDLESLGWIMIDT